MDISLVTLITAIRKRFFQWNSECFEVSCEGADASGIAKDLKNQPTTYRLIPALNAGWYMLEIQINAPDAQVTAQIWLDGKPGLMGAQSLAFPLTSRRLCKRLVYFAVRKNLRIDLGLQLSSANLGHLCVVKVSEKFARSRLLTKLAALHPRYKASLVEHRRSGPLAIDVTGELSQLWNDYCDLFDKTADVTPYPGWIKEFDTLTKEHRDQMLRKAQTFTDQPLVSVLMPVYNPSTQWLEQAVASVQSQIYANWELCIADDASTDLAVRAVLEKWMQEDPRIQVALRTQNGHISAASNSALALAQGEWVVLLDHDDVLAEDALYWVVDAINQSPVCQLIYSDEDKINEAGARSDPYFKPDWNPDLFLSQNMFSHLGVYRADLVRAVGGFRVGFEGSQDYDLALRCSELIRPDQIVHVPRVLYHWRIHAGSTAHAIEAKPYAMVAGERALNEHLQRTGVNATAEAVGYGYRVRYALPVQPPLVSLIIPTRNGLKLLRQCVESIFAKTDYPHYELIIVDNGSDDKATLSYLDALAARADAGLDMGPKVRVIRDARPFNYSALNNLAVKVARGEVVGLLNNDVEVISPGWLTEMVSHAMRPGVGAVGARLWYSDDTLQHAGVVLGIHGVAGHVHRFLPRGDVGYCGRAALIQSFSAVTGACLVVRKALYEAVGGLNELELQVACNDIDFCLKLREAGYRNIFTPYAELYHHESASRGFDDTPEKQARSAKEVAYMHQRWGDALRNDPAYNPNLTLDFEDFSLAWPPRLAGIAQGERPTS
jgi:glycosyltransferase involved in cell wall biosynthesis